MKLDLDKFRFYPIAPSYEWLEKLVHWGVGTVQLRIKNQSDDEVRHAIKCSVALCRKHNCQLFINDYWQWALEYQAFGVHLGYEDVQKADLKALQAAGMRFGLSTHDEEELALALSCEPTYIALGPIFPTQTKVMRFAPQGYQTITTWRSQIPASIPLVAIGGIKLAHAHDIYRAGADSIAVISDVLAHAQPQEHTQRWLHYSRSFFFFEVGCATPAADRFLHKFSSQEALPAVGVAGQERLRRAHVALVGAGALGHSMALYLAGAGVGSLSIYDDDTVVPSNRSRQVLFGPQHVGSKKASILGAFLQEIHPETHTRVHDARFDSTTSFSELVQVVVNASDNYHTRQHINRLCHKLQIPWIDAGVRGWQAHVACFLPDAGCYECCFPSLEAPAERCAIHGVLAPVCGVAGAWAAAEALKCLLSKETLRAQFLRLDMEHNQTTVFEFGKDPACVVCGENPVPANVVVELPAEIKKIDLIHYIAREDTVFVCLDPALKPIIGRITQRPIYSFSLEDILAEDCALAKQDELLKAPVHVVFLCLVGARSLLASKHFTEKGFRCSYVCMTSF